MKKCKQCANHNFKKWMGKNTEMYEQQNGKAYVRRTIATIHWQTNKLCLKVCHNHASQNGSASPISDAQ